MFQEIIQDIENRYKGIVDILLPIQMSKKNRLFLLLTILLSTLGLLLRLKAASYGNLWFDEAYGVRIAEMPLPNMFSWLMYDYSPPLFYTLIHYWIALFGNSESTLHIFPIIFSVISIPLSTYITFKITTSRYAALIVAIFTTLSPFMLNYGIEVRMYSMVYMIGLINIYSMWNICIAGTRKHVAAYIISSSIGLITHTSFSFVIIAGIITALYKLWINNWTNALFWIKMYTVIGLIYLPTFILITSKQLNRIVGSGLEYATVETINVVQYLFSLTDDYILFYQQNSIISLIILCTLAISVQYIIKSWGTHRKQTHSILFFTMFLTIPALIMYTKSGSTIIIRYTITSAFALYSLIAVASIFTIKHKYLPLATTALFVILLQTIGTYYTTRMTLLDRHVNVVTQYVSEHEKPGDLILIMSPTFKFYIERYYQGNESVLGFDPTALISEQQVDEKLMVAKEGKIKVNDINKEKVLPFVQNYDRIWYIPINGTADPYMYTLQALLLEFKISKLVRPADMFDAIEETNGPVVIWLLERQTPENN